MPDAGRVSDPTRTFTSLEEGGKPPTARNDDSSWREPMSGEPSFLDVLELEDNEPTLEPDGTPA